MSFLVEIDRGAYADNALQKFTASSSQFDLDNARAMMWLSQLAYETADRDKVKSILDAWQLTLPVFIANNPATGLPPESACVVGAAGRGATCFAFAGSDPLKFEDWITDFTVIKSPTDLHSGFQDAVESVWGQIKPVIEQRPATGQALFFTGHSLGGALAIVAAERAMRELNATATAVYTFGSPRTGGQEFFDRYTPGLGDLTFRLVHGNDLVATVPPTLRGAFLHVGCSVQCPSGGHFDQQTPIDPRGENKPDIGKSALQAGLAAIFGFAALHPFSSVGPRLLDRLATFLPPMVRDHIPANYFRALSIPLQ
jgi:triacylglycerol lipase